MKNRPIAVSRRWGTALFAALPLLSVGALLSSCDAPTPEYHTPDTMLRLIPEESAIDEDGGPVFVLVELRRAAKSDTTKSILIYVRAKGATSEKLPGPVFCSAKDGGAPETPDTGAPDTGDSGMTEGGPPEGGSPEGGPPDSGAPVVEADITIPDIALLALDAHNTRTTGFVVTIPKGSEPVELVGTAYVHDGAASACDPVNLQIVAIGAARIERRKPDASAPAPEGGPPTEAGAPDDGGDGGDGASSSSSSSSSGTGGGGTGGSGGGMTDGGKGVGGAGGG